MAASLGLSIRIGHDVFYGPHRCPLAITSSANRKRRSVSPFRRSHWQKERDAIRKAKQRLDLDPNSEILVRTTADEIREIAAGVEDEWLRNSILEAAENLDGQNEYHYKKIPKPQNADLLRRFAAAKAKAAPAKGKCKGFRQGKAAARGKGGHTQSKSR